MYVCINNQSNTGQKVEKTQRLYPARPAKAPEPLLSKHKPQAATHLERRLLTKRGNFGKV